MGLAGFFTITRPANAIVAGLAAAVAYLIVTGPWCMVLSCLWLWLFLSLQQGMSSTIISMLILTQLTARNALSRQVLSGDNRHLHIPGPSFFLVWLSAGSRHHSAWGLPFSTPFCLSRTRPRLKNPPFSGMLPSPILRQASSFLAGRLPGGNGLWLCFPLLLSRSLRCLPVNF